MFIFAHRAAGENAANANHSNNKGKRTLSRDQFGPVSKYEILVLFHRLSVPREPAGIK